MEDLILAFKKHVDTRGKPFFVPDRLPKLEPSRSQALVYLPKHVDWSSRHGCWDLSDRGQRLLAYQIVLAEGNPDDIAAMVDGSLLVDLWEEMFVPAEIRTAWQPLIDQVLGEE